MISGKWVIPISGFALKLLFFWLDLIFTHAFIIIIQCLILTSLHLRQKCPPFFSLCCAYCIFLSTKAYTKIITGVFIFQEYNWHWCSCPHLSICKGKWPALDWDHGVGEEGTNSLLFFSPYHELFPMVAVCPRREVAICTNYGLLSLVKYQKWEAGFGSKELLRPCLLFKNRKNQPCRVSAVFDIKHCLHLSLNMLHYFLFFLLAWVPVYNSWTLDTWIGCQWLSEK